jgi:hypothetical protein
LVAATLFLVAGSIGEGQMDLLLRRHLRDVAVNVLD